MKVSLTGPDSTWRALSSAENIGAATVHGIEKALWRTGKDLIREFNRQVLAKNKTGKFYIFRTRAGRRRHQASAPGETPANRKGAYRKGIDFRVRTGKELAFGNSAEYAGFLELGTSRMKKRPGLGNTVRSTERDILRNLAGGIEDEL